MFCAQERAMQASKVRGLMASCRKDILVVDDDRLMREVLTHILTRLGHAVFPAASGKEGLDAIRGRAFDLIFTDLSMPEMDGIVLAYMARKMSIQTPIILITGNDRQDVLPRVAHKPINHIMFKPFGLTEVKNVIDKFLPPAVLETQPAPFKEREEKWISNG